MLTFLYVEFIDGEMHRRFEDFPILPVGSKVYYAKDCAEGLTIHDYSMNLEEPVPNVCCYLERISERLDSEIGPDLGTWSTWLEENGFSREHPVEREAVR